MGSGIAHVFARSGFPVMLYDVDQRFLDRALGSIRTNLGREAAKGKIPESEIEPAISRITTTTDMESLGGAMLAVEAAPERFDLKSEVFRSLDRIVSKPAILASNTSSISITKLAAMTKRPTQVIGMHFFNPVPVMKLVEVVRTIATDRAVYEEVVAFGKSLGKTPVRAKDSTGFIVNRLLVPYLLDAIRALEEGVGSIEDIDNSMKLGCGYPMGPLTLLDFVGLDTTYYISQIMFDEFKEKRFAAPPLLKRMVLAGWNGRKSGRGFYDYADPQKPTAVKL